MKDNLNKYKRFDGSLSNIALSPKDNIKRDIYYIILDAYTKSDTLKEFYDYDNTYFIDFLKNKGFYVANKSTSNYPETRMSLPSMLNMTYNDDKSDKSYDDYMHSLATTLPNNNIIKLLKKMDYKIVHFGSGWSGTYYNPYADFNFYPDFSGGGGGI